MSKKESSLSSNLISRQRCVVSRPLSAMTGGMIQSGLNLTLLCAFLARMGQQCSLRLQRRHSNLQE